MGNEQQLAFLANEIRRLSQELEAIKREPFTPENLESTRVTLGIGWIGQDSTTVATGALIVNSKEGPIKILRA